MKLLDGKQVAPTAEVKNGKAVLQVEKPKLWNPESPFFTQFCNQYGLFVIDEAEHETHGVGDLYYQDASDWDVAAERRNALISNNTKWKEMILDRVRRCVERDKNRPCVILRSMGNECAYGVVWNMRRHGQNSLI